MIKKRIHNDLTFTWRIYRKEEDTLTPEDFGNKTVEVVLYDHRHARATISHVTISEGMITFTFYGKDQESLGVYTAVLYENRGAEGMVALDVVDAVMLVKHSCLEGGVQDSALSVESVDLQSTINAIGGTPVNVYTKEEVDYLLRRKVDTQDLNDNLWDFAVTDQQNTFTEPQTIKGDAAGGNRSVILNGNSIRMVDRVGRGVIILPEAISKDTGGGPVPVVWQDDATSKIPTATKETNGLMSAVDKRKLDELENYDDAEIREAINGKQATVTDLDDIREGAGRGMTALQQHQSLASLVNGGAYNPTTRKIELRHDNVVLAEIDAASFIKDGMVDSVVIENGELVITFNTDAGKEPQRIELGELFDPDNYYTKEEIDDAFEGKLDRKEAIDTEIQLHAEHSTIETYGTSNDRYRTVNGQTTEGEPDVQIYTSSSIYTYNHTEMKIMNLSAFGMETINGVAYDKVFDLYIGMPDASVGSTDGYVNIKVDCAGKMVLHATYGYDVPNSATIYYEDYDGNILSTDINHDDLPTVIYLQKPQTIRILIHYSSATGRPFALLIGDISVTEYVYPQKSDLKEVAFSGKYSALTGRPTKLSDFSNDQEYVTASGMSSALDSLEQSMKDYADEKDLTAGQGIKIEGGVVSSMHENKEAADGGTDDSLVSTGDKYRWNSICEQFNKLVETDMSAETDRTLSEDTAIGTGLPITVPAGCSISNAKIRVPKTMIGSARLSINAPFAGTLSLKITCLVLLSGDSGSVFTVEQNGATLLTVTTDGTTTTAYKILRCNVEVAQGPVTFGFIQAGSHLATTTLTVGNVQLSRITTIDDILSRIAALENS